MKRGLILVLALCLASGCGATAWLSRSAKREHRVRVRLSRPHGMAPEAWRGFVRACDRARVSPGRVTQTIGDFPASKGYHHQDGVVRDGREWLPFSAATDIHIAGLSRRQIKRLVHNLTAQGFAAWFRTGPKWEGGEHIHAVYALLPMKPQLRGQVSQFLRQEKRAGRRPRWARKMKRRYRNARRV